MDCEVTDMGLTDRLDCRQTGGEMRLHQHHVKLLRIDKIVGRGGAHVCC